jgi:hypothetical protein
MNENQPVYKSFNSQEIPFKLGNFLCHLMLREGIENEEKLAKDPFKRQVLRDVDTLEPIHFADQEVPPQQMDFGQPNRKSRPYKMN